MLDVLHPVTEISIITDSKQWTEFLLSQRHPGHLLQSYEWGELNRYLGRPIYRLAAIENGRMVGAMLLSVRPVPLPRQIPGLPLKWLYCLRGPTLEQPNAPALTALIEAAHGIARQEHAVLLRLEPNIADDDPDMDAWLASYHALGFKTNPYAMHPRRSWVLDLRPDLEQLFANFRKAWRRNIRIAERMGVTVREAQSDADFDLYYELLKITSERDHFFLHRKEYHREIVRQFVSQGNAALFLAEHEGEAIATKLVIRLGDWCWDMFAGTSNNKPDLPKAHILQYHSFQWAKSHGCKYFDFRTIPEVLEPDEPMWGVYHYKKGFGGFSRLHMPTQDYIYRPLIYSAWHTFVKVRRALSY